MRQRTEIQTTRARLLRASQTSAESLLWARLRAARLNGYKFVRQHPVGPYIADFACRSDMLIVEVDGATHGEAQQIAYDIARTQALNDAGYRVLRFQNSEVFDNLDGVCETILAVLEGREGL